MNPARDRILDAILETVRRHGAIGLFPHVGADGDALGSAIGLALALNKAGAKTRVFTDEPVSNRLNFIPALSLVTVHRDLTPDNWPDPMDLAIAVDCTEPERLGCRQPLYLEAEAQAALDHHVSSGESGGLKMIDPEAAATGEIMADLITLLEARLGLSLMDSDSAKALMTAIVSDTGGFVYSNTSSRSFATAARLMTFDPDLRQITYRLFDETSRTRLRLTGRMFCDATFLAEGRLVYASVDQALLRSLDASDQDLDGIIADLRKVAGVEVALMFRELVDGGVRINIRSNDHFHAAQFAALYGGGGHAKAAGMTIKHATLDEAVTIVLVKAGEWLEQTPVLTADSRPGVYYSAAKQGV
ncbi:MAG: DHH family phosphoesterase [Eubacteriales bacterium]|nr:DHH family phosphoesterase [Eubacteriales bacterium]